MCQVCETRTPEQKAYVDSLMDQLSDTVNEDGMLDPGLKANLQAAYAFKWMTELEWAWVNRGFELLAMPYEVSITREWVPQEIQ